MKVQEVFVSSAFHTVLDKDLSDFHEAIEKSKIIIKDRDKFYYFKDVLEDSCNAINTYCKYDYPTNKHEGYLYTYGLFQALFFQITAVRYFEEAFDIDNQKFSNYRKKTKKIIDFYKNAFANIDQKNHRQYILFNQIDLNKKHISGLSHCKGKEPKPLPIDICEYINDSATYTIAVLRYIIHINPMRDEEASKTELTLADVVDRFENFDDIESKLVIKHALWKEIYASIKQWVKECKAVFYDVEGEIDNKDLYPLYHRILDKVDGLFEKIDKLSQIESEEEYQSDREQSIELLVYKLKELNSFCNKYCSKQNKFGNV